jgi:uncharacterized protein (DUF608 family)
MSILNDLKTSTMKKLLLFLLFVPIVSFGQNLIEDKIEPFDVLMNNEIKEFQYPVKTFTSKSVKERLISGEIPVVEDPNEPLIYNGALHSGLAKRKITYSSDPSLNESLTINSFYGDNNTT